MSGTIDGFATQGGAARPLATPHMFQVPHLIILGSVPTDISVVCVDVEWKEEAFAIGAFPWRPETHKHWAYQPWPTEMDPAASAEAGLDLKPALGQRVRASILSVLEPFGQANEIAEIDVAFVFEVQDWRLLVQSAAHFDLPDVVVMNLALTTDPRTIDAYLARGTLRSC
jgi:hypothetical protein